MFCLALTKAIMILTVISSAHGSIQSQSSPANIKTYKIHQDQLLNLQVSKPSKIIIDEAQSAQKSHLIPYSVHQNIVESEGSIIDQGNITIHIQIRMGQALFYFAPSTGFLNSVSNENLKKQMAEDSLWEMNSNYLRQYLSLKQGENIVNRQRLSSYLLKQKQGQKLLRGPFCVIVLPKNQVKFTLTLGYPPHQIIEVKQQVPTTIVKAQNQDERTIYLLNVTNDFSVRIFRKKGFPEIKIYQCQSKDQCYFNKNSVPPERNGKLHRNPLKFYLESMLTKFEQFSGTKCQDCLLYLTVDSSQQNEAEVEIFLHASKEVISLQQNEILHEDISAKSYKRYGIKIQKDQTAKVVVQVYEGEIAVTLQEYNSSWKSSPTQFTGVISIQIPKKSSTRSFNLQIEARGGKDAKYSLVYSSGDYEIFIKDGYPTSHVLEPGKNISFFYYNEQTRNDSIYLSLNVNNSKVFNQLKVKIFYYKQSKSESKTQYIPENQSQLLSQAKSFLIEIPGNYPKLEVVFQSNCTEPVEIAVTINNKEIVFLPLYHSLPLQIDKNGGVNLLIRNSEEGFIELVIKKCDQSYPSIAYSLSPQDFRRENYDYESLGDSERITKSSIKVKKGGGLYIRISGDGMTSSFLEIRASYIQFDQKKMVAANTIKKGNYGQINYQLITNSKAEIWFKELECSEQCQKSTRYECYWSTSKSDMFRSMICPNILLLRNTNKTETAMQPNPIKSEGYRINSKASQDGIISFKQMLSDAIIYMGIKAINEKQKTELIYKDIEIVTISGQISRMSTQFLFLSIGIGVFVTALLLFVIRRQARLGYTAVNTSENQKKKKTKLDIIKG